MKALEWLTTFNEGAAAKPADPGAKPTAALFVPQPTLAPIIDRRREREEVVAPAETLAEAALHAEEVAAEIEEIFDRPQEVVEPALAPAAVAERPVPVEGTGALVGPSRPAPAATMDLERLIGMRWFAAIGAVVVVVGVGLFLKLAYDQGWMKLIPPELKCVLGAAFGLGLVGAGEVIRKRVNALGSMGISAAGLGALYASVYSAYGVYTLVPPSLAFVLLMLVSGLGFVVSARANVALLAVLSILAAYLNPFIIGGPGSPLVLPVYLLALLAVGLALSAWRGQPFRVLRPLVWWGTVLLGTFWTLTAGLDEPDIALGFVAVFWAAVHVELGLSARASKRIVDEDRVIELSWADSRFIGTSFSSTIWAAVLSVMIVRWGTAVGDWVPPAAGAVAAVLTSLVLAGHLRVLRDVPRTDAQRLGAGLAMQGGALLIAAVSLATAGWTETLAWLAMGVGAVGAGRWIRSRGLDIYGVVLLSIGGVRLLLIDSPLFWPAIWRYDVGGIVLTHWTLLMCAGAAAWAAASALLLRFAPEGAKGAWRRGVGTVGTIGVLVMSLLMFAHPDADSGSMALVWFVIALLGAAMARSRAWGPVIAATVVAAALATGVVAVGGRPDPQFGAKLPVYAELGGIVVTRWTLLMTAAAATWFGLAGLMPRPAKDDAALRAWRAASLVGVIGAVVLLHLMFLNADADMGSVALVWLGLALATAAGGRFGRSMPVFGAAAVSLVAATIVIATRTKIGGVGAPSEVYAEVAGIVVTRWMLMMVAAAGAWGVFAWLAPKELRIVEGSGAAEFASNPMALVAGLAVVLVFASFLHPDVSANSLSWVWLGLSLVLLGLQRSLPRYGADVLGIAGIGAAVMAWCSRYPLEYMTTDAPLAHPGLWLGLALAAACAGSSLWIRRLGAFATERRVMPAVMGAAVVLLFAVTSLEVARVAGIVAQDTTVRKAAVSIWWGFYAVGLLSTGFALRRPLVRHAGLALLAVATAKAAVVDLVEVPQLWRVVSFIGLGLLMLGVAVVYARVTGRLKPAAAAGA